MGVDCRQPIAAAPFQKCLVIDLLGPIAIEHFEAANDGASAACEINFGLFLLEHTGVVEGPRGLLAGDEIVAQAPGRSPQ
jgi:hypothetical protein